MLSERITEALGIIGITDARVSKLLGRACKCPERRETLDRLEAWAKRVVGGKIEKAREYLENILL